MNGKIIGVFCFLLSLFNLEAMDVKRMMLLWKYTEIDLLYPL